MPPWFTRRVVDVVSKLTTLYYTRKYGTMARHLGRAGITPDERRGFIIIQIDGLSHEHLLQAINAGHLPHVSRLLTEQRLLVAPWRCGLPSTTPAVQAGMMFGNRFDIPGFRWCEKENGRTILTRWPDHARAVQARISQGRAGILQGGSCYVSMFDGDADLALFTLSTLHRQRFFESIRGVGLLLLFLLNPFRVLRLLGKTIMSYLAGLARHLVGLIRPLSKFTPNPFDVISPLLHAVGDALFTEVETFGVMLDIYRCVPSIYANYNCYDEVAHILGPDHPAAFRALRSVDKRIRQINRMRANYRRREYDLYILSDHGNSPSIPFRQQSGKSLGRYVVDHIETDFSVTERASGYAHSEEKVRYLLGELEALEKIASSRMRPVLATIRRYVDRRMLTEQAEDYDLKRQRDVIVCASGPLAHVYFNVSARSLDLIEVMLLYPHLLDDLLSVPGIGAVVGRADARTIVLGRHGGLLVVGDAGCIVEGTNPLAPFDDADYTAAQIHQLAHFPHAGDVIVLGAIEPDGRVTTFEEQAATHGGLGGAQGHPFIAWPPRCPLEPEALDDSQDLYPYFMRQYYGYVPPQDSRAGDATPPAAS